MKNELIDNSLTRPDQPDQPIQPILPIQPEAAMQDELLKLRAENAELKTSLAQVIHQRETLAQQLAFESVLLHTLVENCPFRIYAKDVQSRFIFGNAEVARIMGVKSAAELLGKSDFDFYPKELATLYYNDEQNLLHSGIPVIAKEEPVIDQSSGEPGWTLTTKVHLRDAEGKLLGVLGIGFNITERKQMEQELTNRNAELTLLNRTLSLATRQLVQSEKLAALGALVAGVAHELNTPIGNGMLVTSAFADHIHEFTERFMTGLTRSALEIFLDQANQASDILLRNLRRASDLVTSFKQVAVDQTSAQRRSFVLSDTVAEIIMTMSPTLRKSNVIVHEMVDPAIKMDSYPGPLGQILINLISNALLHGFDGREGGQITIRAHFQGDGIELLVSDDGIGMSAENLQHIFEPFFTTKMGVGGSGLGLHISHNIATGLLGGTVEAESVPMQGTRFLFRLPLLAPLVKIATSAK
jgi:PAS domain S-box-containing protein